MLVLPVCNGSLKFKKFLFAALKPDVEQRYHIFLFRFYNTKLLGDLLVLMSPPSIEPNSSKQNFNMDTKLQVFARRSICLEL